MIFMNVQTSCIMGRYFAECKGHRSLDRAMQPASIVKSDDRQHFDGCADTCLAHEGRDGRPPASIEIIKKRIS